MAKRKVYTDEFKRETIQYVHEHPDMSMYALSKELKVSQTSLNSWIKQFPLKIDNETEKEPTQTPAEEPEENNETSQRNESPKAEPIESTIAEPTPSEGETYRPPTNPHEGKTYRPPTNSHINEVYRSPSYLKQLLF